MYVVAADVAHEKMATDRTETISPSRDEISGKNHWQSDLTGADFWFCVDGDKTNPKSSSIKIINSWQYTRKEMKDFLNWLSTQYEGINVRRMLNEWKWHNIAYTLNIRQKSTKDVDMYFDAPDEHYSFIFDLFWLW